MSNLHNTNTILAAKPKQAKEMIKHNLANSTQWLLRGILAIYSRQTSDEKSAQMTKHHNEIGFNGLDSGILSSFAEQIMRWEAMEPRFRKYDCPLSPKQLQIAQKKMSKYAGQLLLIAMEKAGEAKENVLVAAAA